MSKCAAHAALGTCLRESLARDATDCGSLAACMWTDFCGARPRAGKGSCKTAALCQNACNEHDLGNTPCLCGCLQDADPKAAALLFANDTCAGQSCPKECVAHGDNAACLRCYGLHCFGKQASCLAN